MQEQQDNTVPFGTAPKSPRSTPGAEFGVQPFDALMTEYAFVNNDVVEAAEKQLSHKQVAKARNGRRLTARLQFKVLEAFNAALVARGHDEQYTREDLFNYRG